MKLYLAGPMTGYPEFNFPAFYAAAVMLRSLGHEVFNPAERDNERHGTDISKGNLTGNVEQAAKDHGFDINKTMAHDTSFICLEAEGIALLPGWEKSGGAKIEFALADYLKRAKIVLEATPSGEYVIKEA